jgi:hypothetical protein
MPDAAPDGLRAASQPELQHPHATAIRVVGWPYVCSTRLSLGAGQHGAKPASRPRRDQSGDRLLDTKGASSAWSCMEPDDFGVSEMAPYQRVASTGLSPVSVPPRRRRRSWSRPQTVP